MGMTLMRCALAGLLVLSSLRAEDWPRWRGPDGNGISREKNWTTAWPKEGPKQLWKADVGMGFSGMAVANSRLFTMDVARTKDGRWMILELGDGQVSGIPERVSADDFYRALRERVRGALR